MLTCAAALSFNALDIQAIGSGTVIPYELDYLSYDKFLSLSSLVFNKKTDMLYSNQSDFSRLASSKNMIPYNPTINLKRGIDALNRILDNF